MRTRTAVLGPAFLLAVATGLVGAAVPDGLLLPEARTAEPVSGATTRVTVRADGSVEHAGLAIPRAAGSLILPALVTPLRAFHAAEPDGSLLLAADRRVDFRAVREVLATTDDAGIARVGLLAAPGGTRALRIEQSIRPFDPLTELDQPVGPPPLTVHLRANRLGVGRRLADFVYLPAVAGALDVPTLAAILTEDRRLHPGQDLAIINTDDGVPYADTVAVFDLTREKGYPKTLLAGGPAGPADAPDAPAPTLAGTVETRASVTLRDDGGVDLRAADGTLEPLHVDAITGYESHCDAATCDVVARTATRRTSLGSRPRDVPVPGWLFGKRVHAYAGRLGLAEPIRTGVFSPLVRYPGGDTPPSTGESGGPFAGSPILLGVLAKEEIDAVMKKPANMGRVRRCYGHFLGRGSSASGKITIKFVIAKDGTVASAVVKSSEIEDEGLLGCLTGTIATYVFPRPAGGGIVIVSYPFVFSPA